MTRWWSGDHSSAPRIKHSPNCYKFLPNLFFLLYFSLLGEQTENLAFILEPHHLSFLHSCLSNPSKFPWGLHIYLSLGLLLHSFSLLDFPDHSAWGEYPHTCCPSSVHTCTIPFEMLYWHCLFAYILLLWDFKFPKDKYFVLFLFIDALPMDPGAQ